MTNPLTVLTSEELRARRSAKYQWYDPDVLPMWVAEMDTTLALPIRAALAAAVERGDTGYAVEGGLPAAFTGFAARRWGWSVNPTQVAVVPDVMYGIAETLRLVTRPGDTVIFNTPSYPPFFEVVPLVDRRIVTSPLAFSDGRYRLDLERLERDFAAGAGAYLLCNPQNPTGLVFSRSELLAVAQLAHQYAVRVLVDEIHAPLTYPGVEHVPFASLDAPAAASAISFHSASKAWNLAGLKAALVVPGPAAVGFAAEFSELSRDGVGHFGVLASEAAYTLGESWLEDLLVGLTANRSLLGKLLAEHLPSVGYAEPDGTFLAWLDCRALDLGADPAAVFLERGRVALQSGPKFGEPGHGFARLNLATSPDRLTEAVRRMAAAL